jgi:hypothetical protein
VLDWCDRLVCSQRGGREIDMVVTRERGGPNDRRSELKIHFEMSHHIPAQYQDLVTIVIGTWAVLALSFVAFLYLARM